MESKIEFTKADESSFDGTAADRYSADEVAFVSQHDAKPNVVRSASEHFKAVLQTLKHNKVMVKTEADGIYVRMAGNESKGESFSLEWGKVVSF